MQVRRVSKEVGRPSKEALVPAPAPAAEAAPVLWEDFSAEVIRAALPSSAVGGAFYGTSGPRNPRHFDRMEPGRKRA